METDTLRQTHRLRLTGTHRLRLTHTETDAQTEVNRHTLVVQVHTYTHPRSAHMAVGLWAGAPLAGLWSRGDPRQGCRVWGYPKQGFGAGLYPRQGSGEGAVAPQAGLGGTG